MLLEAGFLALFFAPRGLMPGWGASDPPSRASLWLLQWEWFRIYFESGMVKLLSGDEQWRNLTAMDEYYQNGPLPTWIGEPSPGVPTKPPPACSACWRVRRCDPGERRTCRKIVPPPPDHYRTSSTAISRA